MEPKYNIVFSGQFAIGVSRESAVKAFASRFNISEDRAGAMLPAAGTSILKQNADQATVVKFQAILDAIGVIVDLQPVRPSGEGLTLTPAEDEPDSGSAQPGSQPTFSRDNSSSRGAESGLEGRSFNPYEKVAPRRQAEADGGSAVEDTTIISQKVFEGAVTVPAARGISWITEAYSHHVSKSLGAWIGAVMLYFLLSIVMSLIPVLGSIALMLIGPVIIAGFMIGARDQAEGQAFTIRHLFSGFDESPAQLILVSLLYFVGMIAVVLLTIALFGLSFLSVANPEAAAPTDLLALLLPFLVMLLFMLPLMMAYWFAPALVALEGLSAIEAMKQSFMGCLKNMLPMLVYGILASVLMLVAMIPLMLGLILLLPVLVASMYVAYTDIFRSTASVFKP